MKYVVPGLVITLVFTALGIFCATLLVGVGAFLVWDASFLSNGLMPALRIGAAFGVTFGFWMAVGAILEMPRK